MTTKKYHIPFNKPFIIGKELDYIAKAVESGHLSANGYFTEKCRSFFGENYGVKASILTTSCTAALELSALLLDIKAGDEIIAPSFSFVSTVNPFVLRGAKIIFADSCINHPNMDVNSIESLITSKTKAIVCVHYAGMACDMEKLMNISERTGISIIEDAAHAIESKWNGVIQLGTIGKFGCFSFHETKNIIAGEGGLLCINNQSFTERAEIISDKGTNRGAYFRGETEKYEWVMKGSSFMPSELNAAFLFAQLEKRTLIQQNRINSWQLYHSELEELEKSGFVERPHIPDYAMTNGHIYYLVCRSVEERERLINTLREAGIQAVFHYQSLHKSPYYNEKHDGRALPNADRMSSCLLRLPLFYGIEKEQIYKVSSVIRKYFGLTE